MSKSIKNIPQEWQKLSKDYFSGVVNEPEIEVSVGAPEQPNGDATVLRYFFPLAHGLHEHGIIPRERPVLLNINTSSVKEQTRTEVIMRIKAFLTATGDNQNYEIFIDGVKFRGNVAKWDGSSIFPLFEVSSTQNYAEGNHYSILRKELVHFDTDLITATLAEKKLFAFRDVLREKVLSPANYKGTADFNIRMQNKEELSKAVKKHLSIWLPQMDILSQIIWLYILWVLIDSKEIWTRSSQSCVSIDENVIQKCRNDAVAYGEGMYQLVENACLHSFGKNAWFGFRIHRAGGHVAMSDFLSEAYTRNQLYINYSKCFTEVDDTGKKRTSHSKNIFNQKHRVFFEMYVIDDACNQEGIVNKYNKYMSSQNYQKIFGEYRKLWVQDVKKQRQAWEVSLEQSANNTETHDFIEPVFDETKIQRPDLWELAKENVKNHLYPELNTIEEIIERKPKANGKSLEEHRQHVEDITTHYGLRLLRRIVSINNGYLMCKSPHGESNLQQYYNGNTTSGLSEDGSYVTEWYALMPMSYEWGNGDTQSYTSQIGGTFGTVVEKMRSKQICIDGKDLLSTVAYTTIEEKTKRVNEIVQKMDAYLNKQSDNQLSDAVIFINIDSYGYQNLELFSKALFALISSIGYVEGQEKPERIHVRIALLIQNADYCSEFVRLFSVYYADGKQPDMKNTQIAICSPGKEQTYQVNYILAGTDLKTVWTSANASAHYGVVETLERLPVLEYLVQEGNKSQNTEVEEIAFFPFDLYLRSVDSAKTVTIDPWKDSWFINRMHNQLMTNLEDSQNGCLVNDVHIRLGSKVHLSRFYEAQLLFHESNYIFRFAYLIAQDLLFGAKALTKGKHIFILGYEKYSAQLVQQVGSWLLQSKNYASVNAAIIRDGTEEGSVLFEPLFDEKRSFSSASVEVVTLLPVGTTLSTIYKMHNTAHQAFPNVMSRANFSRNYCMILVNDDLVNPSGTLSDVTLRYWSTVEQEKKVVTLQRDKKDSSEIKVNYLLPAPAQWSAPDECMLCRETAGDIRPVISVTKSDVMPGSIFLLRNRKHGFFSELFAPNELAKNSTRINRLFGYIRYSHIYRKNNHYQFYIDFEKLFRENREDIIETIKSWKVQPNAYNVVVSPLQVDNSPFILEILNNVFCGNCKFVHLEFTKSYREEVRTKFSHISEEFRLLKQSNPNAKINVYFADVSIVSGSILNRARVLLQMLLQEAEIKYEEVTLFEKIFLLVNRCSYDTLNSFIKDPKNNLKAYIRLFVPSYNIDEGVCPACNLNTKYRLLKKRSATGKLGKLFQNLENKHQKRSRQKHEEWMESQILNEPSYLAWLKQWLYTNVSFETGKIMCFVPSCKELYYSRGYEFDGRSEKEDFETAQWLKLVIEAYLRRNPSELSKVKLVNIIEFSKTHNPQKEDKYTLEQSLRCAPKVVDLVMTHLIGVRNFMRLYSMHNAYQTLETATKKVESLRFNAAENQYVTIKRYMLKMIADAITPNVSKDPLKAMLEGVEDATKARFLFAYKIEWLISYVKVLSREHISNHYCYRQAIASIMRDLLTVSSTLAELNDNREWLIQDDSTWEAIIKVLSSFHKQSTASAAQLMKEKLLRAVYQYHLNMMLLHRMADLQIPTIIQTDYIIQSVLRYYRLGQKAQEDNNAGHWISLPQMEDVIGRYLKSIKLSTMAVDDDIPCLSLCQTLDELSMRIDQVEDSKDAVKTLVKVGRYIYLENVRMIYSGMYGLRKQISQIEWDSLKRFRPADNFREYMGKLSAIVDSYLSTCYSNLDHSANQEDILYQHPLGNFCRFWHKANQTAPVLDRNSKATDEAYQLNPVAYMLQYYVRLETLSKSQKESQTPEDLPYQYEELCRTICGFTGAKMCYLVACSECNYPEIFAQSGYYVPFLESGKILTPQTAEILLQSVKKEEEDSQKGVTHFFEGICQVNHNGQGYLILDLALHGNFKNKEHFHIIVQREDEYPSVATTQIKNIDALRHARDILFMRETLQETLSEHYTRLANMRFDCSYVRPMKEVGVGEIPNPVVLHFSDLHISKTMDKYANDPRRRIGKPLENVLEKRKIDLLAITGDIADGRDGDAYHLINNYRYAEKLLNEIVTTLWVDDEQYLSHDWKRRIIITTGNHDYASMNQFKAILKQRVLSVGTPIEEDSGTMSKFAYFIDFLIRYLDPPIDELLQNDLNEIRYYEKLNLKVMAINCSSGATARRTNKVGPNYEKVLELFDRKVWVKDHTVVNYTGEAVQYTPFRLCLAHYSYRYRLSYFQDKYDVIPGWDWDQNTCDNCVINQLVNYFLAAMRAELVYTKATMFNKEVNNPKDPTHISEDVLKDEMMKWIVPMLHEARDEIKNHLGYFRAAMTLWEKGMPSSDKNVDLYYKRLSHITKPNGSETLTQAAKRVVDSIRNNDLFQEVVYYCNWLEKQNDPDDTRTDENISRLIFEINESLSMSEFDINRYKELFFGKVGDRPKIDLLLAGHIHAYAEDTGVLVADKMLYEDKTSINGYVIYNMQAYNDSDKPRKAQYDKERL